MTFQQLQYLLEVSRTGSISGAAKNLFLAQSSVSASISNLEEELGFPIFIRSKKGVIPTVQGAEVLEQAAQICENYRLMTCPEEKKKKQFRISAPAMEVLDEVFSDFICRFGTSGDASFRSDSFSTVDAIQKLSSFELDVALLLNHKARFLGVETLLKDKELSHEVIGEVPVVIQVGIGHPLYEKETVEPEDLDGKLFVDLADESLLHNEYLKGVVHLSPENTVTVKSEYAAHLLVAKGLCFSIGVGAPRIVREAFGIRTVPLKDVRYTLTAVTNPKRRISPEAEAYIRAVKQKFGRER